MARVRGNSKNFNDSGGTYLAFLPLGTVILIRLLSSIVNASNFNLLALIRTDEVAIGIGIYFLLFKYDKRLYEPHIANLIRNVSLSCKVFSLTLFGLFAGFSIYDYPLNRELKMFDTIIGIGVLFVGLFCASWVNSLIANNHVISEGYANGEAP